MIPNIEPLLTVEDRARGLAFRVSLPSEAGVYFMYGGPYPELPKVS